MKVSKLRNYKFIGRRVNKKISFLILSGVLFLPSFASALTVQDIVDGAIQTTLYVASGITVILWVVTGLLFLSAQGDPSKLKTAKTSLFAAIAGTAIVIIASSAIGLVSSAFNLG
jgi:uncharacterized membrane protein (DUF485 family)